MVSQVGQSPFHDSIPVIDMKEIGTRKFSIGLKEAFKSVGFVAVLNAGIESGILDNAYTAAQNFFSQSLTKKREIKSSTNSGERGYVDTESAKGQTARDYKEFIHMGRELSTEQKMRLEYPENIWPKDFDLKEPMMMLYSHLEKLIEPLSIAISQAASLKPETICSKTHEGDHLLRCVHYPQSPPESEEWAKEHTDINFFTLLPSATCEGLQVKLEQGRWIDAVVPKNALIINVGDSLQNLTNGLFRSAVHRVKAKTHATDRFSLVFFAHAHRSDSMDPLKECIDETGGVRKYPRATRQKLLEQRIIEMGRGSRQMMQNLHESGLIDEQESLGIDCSNVIDILKTNGIRV